MATTYIVEDQRDSPAIVGGRMVEGMAVDVTVPGVGSFTHTFTLAEFTPENVARKLQARADEMAAIKGLGNGS